jgi:hypothetical protein
MIQNFTRIHQNNMTSNTYILLYIKTMNSDFYLYKCDKTKCHYGATSVNPTLLFNVIV